MKSTALHDDMAAKLLRRGQLDDLIQSVFDHGIGKAGGNIRNRGTFFLCLLDIGIHENRAPGTEVNRVFGK